MSLLISCDECSMRGTDVCGDCVVSFICRQPQDAVIINADEERVVRMLGRAGLVPALRHQRRANTPETPCRRADFIAQGCTKSPS